MAQKQHSDSIPLPAERGRIFDRKYRPLVYNERGFSIHMFPRFIRSIDTVVEIISKYQLKSKDEMISELKTKKTFFPVKKFIDYKTGDHLRSELRKYRLDNAIVVRENTKRIYPYGQILSSIIGFVGEDGTGLAGIEYVFDQYLKGKTGWEILQKDALGNKYHWPSNRIQKPVNGYDIILTIDLDIQSIVFEKLSQYVKNLNALRGAVIVLDCQDGSILALADYPDFDPQNFQNYPMNLWTASSITDEFEPGSVYKLLICAAALRSPQMNQLLHQSYNTSNGFIVVGGKKIKDVHNNGIITFDEIFIKSSNIGVSLLCSELSPVTFYQTERQFGFGTITGVELPGETKGFVDPPSKLTPLRFANNAFGQGVRTTLIQLATAYMAVANDGNLLKPYIVKEITVDNKIIYRGKKQLIRSVLTHEQSALIKEILARAVQEGTGKQAAIPGVRVCGKTGTAQKLEPSGKYSQTKSIMSFIGFFPQDKPRYLIAVMIDEPQKFRFAGEVACPLFREIAEQILLLEKLAPPSNATNLLTFK
jgi:cell division protein FtsI/penicillin-binding protein 2